MEKLPTYESTTANANLLAAGSPAIATTAHRRTIQDLRAQIIANGTIICPKSNPEYGSQDHIEVLLAQTPPSASPEAVMSTRFFDDQRNLRTHGSAVLQKPGSAQASSSSRQPLLSWDGESNSKHYAILVRRTGSGSSIRIILKGPPKDTVEDALAWMLTATECWVHDLIIAKGTKDTESCIVM